MLISPAPIDVPESVLADLRERLARTRWFDSLPGSRWSLGTDVDYLRELGEYWRQEFRWYDTQRRLNSLGPIATEIAGQRIHAFHVRSPRSDAIPLLMVHGWPGSVIEFIDCMAPLADPAAHGAPGDPAYLGCFR